MQAVSREYKKRIRDQLRNTGYMMISFGVINQKAQSNAKLGSHGVYHPLTIEKELYKLFSQEDGITTVYEALEEDFTPVDGSYLFPPREGQVANYTGITSKDMVSNGVFRLEVNLGETPFSFKGFTIDFGENYPKRIKLETDTGTIVEDTVTGSVYKTEQVFKEVKKIIITVLEMVKPNSRVRIRSIFIGYGLLYTNTHIIDSSLESHSSPIGAECPQIDFVVTLNNRDRYFDVDNPNSVVNFLEIGQELTVFYGYNLGSEIEWVKGATLECSAWESDEHIARIKAVDKFRRWDTIYEDESDSDVQQRVIVKLGKIMRTIGMTEDDLILDPYFKNRDLVMYAPVPKVKVREALQLIANANRAILFINRDGKLEFKTRYKPTVSIISQGDVSWSNVRNTLNNKRELVEYAVLGNDSVAVDGHALFYPRSANLVKRADTGFVGKNGVITLVLNAERKYYELKLEFGDTLPYMVQVMGLDSNGDIADIAVEREITKHMVIPLDFKPFSRLSVWFLGGDNQLITLNSIELGDETDFVIGKWDMLSSPKAIKQEQVKDIVVKCYKYQEDPYLFETVNLLNGEQDVVAGTTTTISTKDCCRSVTIPAENQEWVELVSSSYFSKTLRFKKTGRVRLNVTARKVPYTLMEITKNINREGKTVTIDNPLVSTVQQAQDLANWIAEYYKVKVTYEYDTRGFPELDVNDYIFQENDFEEDMQSEVTGTTLTFNGAWRGKIKARRREK